MDDVRTIVVGADASPESADALIWARQVAGPTDQIAVVHAWEIPLVTGYDMVVAIDPNEVEKYATEGLAELVEESDDDRLLPIAREGHAGRALVEEADERDAAMIVVGHRGKGRMSMMLGSTANYVIHHTTRPVVVIRGDHGGVPRRVVVGVDDHDLDTGDDNESVRALRWAYELDGVEEVRVVHSWFLPALAVGMFSTIANETEAMDESAQAVVGRVMHAAGDPPAGVEVTGEAVRGTPGFALIEASREADLVVVGSRGRGGFAGMLLGSTSADAAAHSHSPVAIVR
ncbi:MAG: universal stress protein [Ilumatobacter sp.]|uniref:universal stress protein n=1 Tax=Ilumatobacter sp. TaxID=1967498 RepID=UPI002613FF05|nr:universal stress protein [Ilumatobacter sp.]MDJ0770059.1 universal stress protein [Ilumatobacter sp.]